MQRLKDFFLPHLEVTGKSTFCGITTSSHEGVVDTAAEGGLIGSIALKRFCHALSQRGSGPQNNLQQKELVVVLRCWESHCFQSVWAARTGLECTVVEGEVPLLLPVQLLKHLRVVLDFRKYTFKASCVRRSFPCVSCPVATWSSMCCIFT